MPAWPAVGRRSRPGTRRTGSPGARRRIGCRGSSVDELGGYFVDEVGALVAHVDVSSVVGTSGVVRIGEAGGGGRQRVMAGGAITIHFPGLDGFTHLTLVAGVLVAGVCFHDDQCTPWGTSCQAGWGEFLSR
ncbi:hypothetical protein F4Y93_12755 [Candidatus Poribacteria bacterium]|nr:hypothetical protein [Candidatus Poribacteria bacterium]